MTPFVVFLILIYASGTIEDNFSGLNQKVLEDIYNIYNSIPLLIRKVKNVTVTPDNIKYYLFLNNYTKNYTIINSHNASVVSKNDPVLFLIHGWTQDRTTSWYRLFTETFFELNDRYNIIQVDYSLYSKLDYVSASSTATEVGNIIGKFIATLVRNHSIPIDNVLIIGHSLGGQVSSFLGKKVQEVLGQKLPQIIALDPAGPLFHGRPKSKKLNKKDAVVVEVVHTNGGVFGYLKPCGTIDFFPNGGTIQSGCIEEIFTNVSDLSDALYCNHHRSWELFSFAVKNRNHFKARQCSSWFIYNTAPNSCSNSFIHLGDIKNNKTGNYYLKTTGVAPYYEN